MFMFSPLTRADLPFLIAIRNECRNFLHDGREFTLAQCEEWFRAAKPDFHLIEHNGEPIGYFRLSNHNARERTIYVGADLHERFRGRGLMAAAYDAFLPLVKQRYGVAAVELEVLSHNAVALALYQRLGFVELETRKAFAVRQGCPVDSIVMVKAL